MAEGRSGRPKRPKADTGYSLPEEGDYDDDDDDDDLDAMFAAAVASGDVTIRDGHSGLARPVMQVGTLPKYAAPGRTTHTAATQRQMEANAAHIAMLEAESRRLQQRVRELEVERDAMAVRLRAYDKATVVRTRTITIRRTPKE